MWDEIARDFDQHYKLYGLENPENSQINLKFSGFNRGDPRLHRYTCWLYYNHIKQIDKLKLLDRVSATCKKADGFGYQFGSHFISFDLLLSIEDFYFIYQLDKKIFDGQIIVAELGAGWGRLIDLITKINPKAQAIIFDLPESLIASQSYLPMLQPHIDFAEFDAAKMQVEISRQSLTNKRVTFCLPEQLKNVKAGTIDVIINLASFQEMPKNYVRLYLEYFSIAAANGHCYIRQLIDGRTHQHTKDIIASFDEYDFPGDWRRSFYDDCAYSPDFFVAGFSIPPTFQS